MLDTAIQNMLLRLNYSQDWLGSGVVTERDLKEQIKQLESGEDDNTEHYRYRTLDGFLKSKLSFDDNILRHILKMIEIDVDKSMANSAAILLLKNKTLTDLY